MCNEIVTDWRGYIERNNFVFTNATHPANIYDAIYIRNVKNDRVPYRRFPNRLPSIEEHIEYINKLKLEKAVIFASDLSFLVSAQ